MKTPTKIVSADTLFNASSDFLAGFNSKVDGELSLAGSSSFKAGFYQASDLIKEGGIFFTHNFGCSCSGHPFTYGGTWVCNSCGNKDVNKKWWNIRVFQDGSDFCVTGEHFTNLQESSNYAFGKTKEEALTNYKNLHE